MATLLSLPDEMLLGIVGHLEYSLDLCALSQTCHRFYSITQGQLDENIRQLSELNPWNGLIGRYHRAASVTGNAACVRRLFKVSPSIATMLARQERTLVVAARRGYTEVIGLILDHGGNPEKPHQYTDPSGGNPLLAAIYAGQDSVVQLLLAHGVKTTFTRSCYWCGDYNLLPKPVRQPLSVAAEKQHLSIMRLLLSHGCDPLTPEFGYAEQHSGYDYSAIGVAAGVSMEALQIFVDAGVKPDFSSPSFPAKYKFMKLLQKGDFLLIKFLMEHGAKVDTDLPADIFPFENLYPNNLTQFMQASVKYPEQAAWLLEQIRFYELLKSGNLRQYVYLTVGAVYSNSESLLRLVLDAGWAFRKDWSSKKPHKIQRPPINRAQEWKDHLSNLLSDGVKQGNLGIVKLLLDCGADPRGTAKYKLKGKGFYPPIYAAVDGGFLEIVTLLLDRGANPFPRFHGSLLSRAIRCGPMATKMTNLVLTGGLLGPKDPAGFDLIADAVEGGKEVFDLVVHHLGVEPNLKNPSFEPAFARAVLLDDLVQIERFLREGFDIKSHGKSGKPKWSKDYWMTGYVKEVTRDLLWKYGLDPRMEAPGELIPLMFPRYITYRPVVFLLKKGADPWRPFGFDSSSKTAPDPLQKMDSGSIEALLTSLDERQVPFNKVKSKIEEAARSTDHPQKAQLLWRWYWRRTYPPPEA